jgi:hypothetical protein
MKTHTSFAVLLALLAPAGLLAQGFSTPSPPPWKGITVPCSAAPVFDLTRGTGYTITLCSTPAVASFTNITRANGKHLDMIVCQDAAGSRTFSYPNTVLGTAPINSIPNICTAQAFAVMAGQVFAVSAGQQQSLVPVPSLLLPPWSTMAYNPGDGVLSVANELTGVLLQMSSATAIDTRIPKEFAHTNTGGGIVTATASFYIVQPDLTGTNVYGFGMSDHNNGELCALYVGASNLNRVIFFAQSTSPWTVGSSADLGALFNLPGRQIIIRYAQNLTTKTATCAYSTDGGGTFNSLGTRGNDFYGGYSNPYLGIGGAWTKPTGAAMHITGFTIL